MNHKQITLNTRIVRRTDLIASDLSDQELVMMDIDKGYYYGVDNVGKVIWDLLAQPTSISDICTEIFASFDADQSQIESDTLNFINQLHDESLVEVVNDG